MVRHSPTWLRMACFISAERLAYRLLASIQHAGHLVNGHDVFNRNASFDRIKNSVVIFDVDLGTRRNDDQIGAHPPGFADIGASFHSISLRFARGRQGIAESIFRENRYGIPESIASSQRYRMMDEDSLRERKAALVPHLDERQRRLWAAAEVKAAGRGGIAAVARLTRIAASTTARGLKEFEAPETLPQGRVRRPGGGRKSLVETDSRLLHDLNALIEPEARGDPMSPLRWTCKSLRRLAAELNKLGHKITIRSSANC